MMHDVLSGLTQQPGVKLAAIISSDGVPLCVLERSSTGNGEFVDCTNSSQPSLEGQRIDPASLVALAASWVDDVMRAGGQIAWEVPKRFVLSASQGTLVVQQGPNAHAMVVVEPSMSSATVTLALELAVERLHKLLRDLGRFDPDQNAAALPSAHPAGDPMGATPMTAPAPPQVQPPSIADYAAGSGIGTAHPTDASYPGGPPAAAQQQRIDPSGTPSNAPFDSTGDH